MADALTIDGTAYDVASVSMDLLDLASVDLTWGDTLVSSQPGVDTVVRSWRIQTAIMTKAEAIALRTLLLAPGTVTAGGYEITPSGTIVCRAVRVGRVQRLLEDWRTLRFGLEQVSP